MSNALKKFAKRITANRKQFGIMVALVAVAAFMWGKLILQSAPRSASANVSLVKKATSPGADSEAQAPATTGRQKVEVTLSVHSKRDLFRMNMQEFVRIEPSKVIAAPNSPAQKSDEARRAEMLAKLTTLKLNSTIMQDEPKALLNGKLFQTGSEPLEGFKVTRITQFSVYLKHSDWDEEFELRMYRN